MIKKIALGLGGLWLVASLGSVFAQTNPTVSNQVQWDSEQTKDLFYRACADCHSYETKWPWYSSIAPVSFAIIHHVDEGREHFNISVADMGEAYEAGEEVEEGEMPLSSYLPMHPEANLTPEEKALLIQGLNKTFGSEGDGHGKSHGHKHDDDDDDDD